MRDNRNERLVTSVTLDEAAAIAVQAIQDDSRTREFPQWKQNRTEAAKADTLARYKTGFELFQKFITRFAEALKAADRGEIVLASANLGLADLAFKGFAERVDTFTLISPRDRIDARNRQFLSWGSFNKAIELFLLGNYREATIAFVNSCASISGNAWTYTQNETPTNETRKESPTPTGGLTPPSRYGSSETVWEHNPVFLKFSNSDDLGAAIDLLHSDDLRGTPNYVPAADCLIIPESAVERIRSAGLKFNLFTRDERSPTRSDSFRLPKWKNSLEDYDDNELVALVFPTLDKLHDAIDVSYGPDLLGMPHVCPGRRSMIVPKVSVPVFEKAGLKFTIELIEED